MDGYDYSSKFQEIDDVPPTSRLESHKEDIKEKTGGKILAAHKLLTRIPVL